jgi:CheY-like chemotaxis protein
MDTPITTTNNPKITILVTDDDTFLLDVYSQKFTKSGYMVYAADSGEMALKKLHEGLKPDIMLFDVIMPGMTGLELLEAIRTENLVPNATVIMLTNQNAPEDLSTAKRLGVDGYIVKAMAIPSEVLVEVEKIHTSHTNKQK